MAQRQFSPPTSFNRSPLVQLLASLEVTPVVDASQSLAEKLGHWVAWTDAISLSAALGHTDPADAESSVRDVSPGLFAALQEFTRVRKELTEAIANDRMFTARTSHGGENPLATPAEAKAEFSLYRRQYLAHQRTMEDRVAALRAQVRAVASTASSALRQLAALDAVLDDALSTHQRRLLANVPHVLEKRLKTLMGADRTEGAADAGAQATDLLGAPADLGKTLQQLLLAELGVRLQPIEGMMQALGNQPMGHS
jgi:hypothetical protein